MDDINILEYLTILLKRDKISFSDIAKKLDTTPQNISQALKKNDISIERLKKIAAASGYTVIIEFKKIEGTTGKK